MVHPRFVIDALTKETQLEKSGVHVDFSVGQDLPFVEADYNQVGHGKNNHPYINEDKNGRHGVFLRFLSRMIPPNRRRRPPRMKNRDRGKSSQKKSKYRATTSRAKKRKDADKTGPGY
jgi:hypothetical protein